MKNIDLLVFGSGSLTRALVIGLAGGGAPLLSSVIVARNREAAETIALLASARAAAGGMRATIVAEACDLTPSALDALFRRYRPRVVLTLASLQSPWTMGQRWRQWVAQLGYGFTLPLQALLADRILRAASSAHPRAHRINACYPDLVNGVLEARGISVEGGIGNIAIVDAVLQSRTQAGGLSMLAHHAHVAALISGQWMGLPLPVVWQHGRRLSERRLGELLRHVRLPPDDRLNAVTGPAAVPMLYALAGRTAPWSGHAPGVHGLPGGYPVLADEKGIRLALPAELTLEAAREQNVAFSAFDGVLIQDGVYRLRAAGDAARSRLNGTRLPEELLAWRAADLVEQALALERFRAKVESG